MIPLPLVPREPEWTENHSIALREFLMNPVGQRVLSRLFFMRPRVEAGTREDRMAKADQLAGYEAAINDLMTMAVTQPVTEEDRKTHNESVSTQSS